MRLQYIYNGQMAEAPAEGIALINIVVNVGTRKENPNRTAGAIEQVKGQRTNKFHISRHAIQVEVVPVGGVEEVNQMFYSTWHYELQPIPIGDHITQLK